MNALLNDIFRQAAQSRKKEDVSSVVTQVLGLIQREGGALFEELQRWCDGEMTISLEEKAFAWQLFARGFSAHGDLEASARFFREALGWSADEPEALCGLGFVELNRQEYLMAESIFERVLEGDVRYFNAWVGLGMARRALKKMDEAVHCYDQALALNPKSFEVWSNRGNVLKDLKRFEEAFESYEQAHQVRPDYLPALKGKVSVLQDTQQPQPAKILLERALAAFPQDADLWLSWARVSQMMGDYDEAQRVFQQLLQQNSYRVEALQGLGNVAFLRGEVTESIHYYTQVVARKPDARSYHNLGVAYTRVGEWQSAKAAHENAIALNPAYRSAHVNHALLNMLQGNLEAGLPEYEWRLQASFYQSKHLPMPPWQGEPLAGKTLLVLAEQGFGDAFMMLRYFPLLRKQGAKVALECRPELKSLFEACPDIDVLLDLEGWQASPQNYDYYCYLLSLPCLLKTTLDTIPPLSSEQFIVEDLKQQQWQNRFLSDSDYKIGITWASKADHPNAGLRSCEPQFFEPLAGLPGVTLYSFQKGTANPGGPWIDLGPALHDFSDTVAAVSHMDLVISIDTALVHVAGSVHRPTWVVLPTECDWRWFTQREDSPWYPSMRVFRQQRMGDWGSVFQQVYVALERLRSSA